MSQTTYNPVARWESRSGKWWAEVYHDGVAAFYRGEGCGGNLGMVDKETAISMVQKKVDEGFFRPGSLKIPMKRVK